MPKTKSEIEFRKKIRTNAIFDTRDIQNYTQLVKKMSVALAKHPKQPTQRQLDIASDELQIVRAKRYVKQVSGKHYAIQEITIEKKEHKVVIVPVKGKKRRQIRDIKTGKILKWVD